MKKTSVLFFLIFICPTIKLYCQNIFPEKFDDCNTDRFALESDTTTAKIQDEQLFNILASFDEKTRKRIRGTLSLQIIVSLDGNSCLISLKNDTNIKTKNLNLKQKIDHELKWNNLHERVAAIIVFRFEENGTKFKRLGMNANKGIHELSNN
ncbi:MAG TPA: hypothetical protein VD884_20285 [Ohtaekwangia sp.]|nr:hypothetical protein [Ohtaekwangia sp.]